MKDENPKVELGFFKVKRAASGDMRKAGDAAHTMSNYNLENRTTSRYLYSLVVSKSSETMRCVIRFLKLQKAIYSRVVHETNCVLSVVAFRENDTRRKYVPSPPNARR